MLNNVAVGQLAIDLDVRGDNLVLASEADGGVRALLEGAYALADGRIDAALVGGVAEPVMPASLARARLRGTLGRGAAPGEGAAAFLLGSAPARASARLSRRRDHLRRRARSAGGSRDAYARAFARALAVAGLDAAAVDAVFLHAAGPEGDAEAELAALGDVFPARSPALVATKGALGHVGAAAPGVDLALAVRALAEGRLPPSLAASWMPPRLRDALRPGPAVAPKRILVSAASSAGAAAALIVEASA